MPKLTLAACHHLPAELARFLASFPEPPLDGGEISSDSKAADWIASHRDLGFESPLTDSQRLLCQAGLWLLAGDLERSHQISQRIESAEGSFWHGIMHRREGDFSNAKYWFRRVGQHQAFTQLAAAIKASPIQVPEQWVASQTFDPFAFVDACQIAIRTGTDSAMFQQVQWLEWQCLFAASCGRL